MSINDYTTPDSIRNVLGVTDDELAESVIEDPVYATLLDEAVYKLSPTLADDFSTLNEQNTKSAVQTRFLNVTKAWAAYQMAHILLGSLKMFAPKVIKSEKDAFERIADPYQDTKIAVSATLGSLATTLAELYTELYPAGTAPAAVPARIYAINVALGVDPVTGV